MYHSVPVPFSWQWRLWTYQVVMNFFSQVRLRGIGSGFLEGSDGTEAWIMGIYLPNASPTLLTPPENMALYGLIRGLLRDNDGSQLRLKLLAACSYQANMPLQLNVSCTDYTDYVCSPSFFLGGISTSQLKVNSCGLGWWVRISRDFPP